MSFLFTLIPSLLCISPKPFDTAIVTLNNLLYLFADISHMCLLAILILRLINSEHITLSKREDWSFIILYAVTLTFTIFAIIEYLYVGIAWRGNWNAAGHALGINLGINGPIAICLYIVTASYCIALFVCKIITAATDKIAYTLHQSKQQMIMIQRAIKYVSILSVAVIASIVTAICVILASALWNTEIDYNYSQGNNVMIQCMTLLTLCCCFINALCLYLHFAFSDKYYTKYCKFWLECCWRKTLQSVARKSVKNEFRVIPHEEEELDDAFAPCVNKEALRNSVITKS